MYFRGHRFGPLSCRLEGGPAYRCIRVWTTLASEDARTLRSAQPPSAGMAIDRVPRRTPHAGPAFAPRPPVDLPKSRRLVEAEPVRAPADQHDPPRTRSSAWLPLSVAGAVALGAIAHAIQGDDTTGRPSARHPDASELRLMSLDVPWRALPPAEPAPLQPTASDARPAAPPRAAPSGDHAPRSTDVPPAQRAGPEAPSHAHGPRREVAAERASSANPDTTSEPQPPRQSPDARTVDAPRPAVVQQVGSPVGAAGEPTTTARARSSEAPDDLAGPEADPASPTAHSSTGPPTRSAGIAAPPAALVAEPIQPRIAVVREPAASTAGTIQPAAPLPAAEAAPAPTVTGLVAPIVAAPSAGDSAASAATAAEPEKPGSANPPAAPAAGAPATETYVALPASAEPPEQQAKAGFARTARARPRSTRSASLQARRARAKVAQPDAAEQETASNLPLARYAP